MTQAELMRLLERGTEGMPEASEAVSADAASTLDDMAPAFNWQPPVQPELAEPEAITPESGVPAGRKPLRAPVPTSVPLEVPRSDGTSALGREDLAEQPLSQAPVMPGVLGSQADDAARRNQAPEDPIKAAGGRDRMNALLRSIELGGKQMSAGLGGGPVGELVTQRTDEEGKTRALKAGEDMRAAAGARQGQADAFTKERIAAADREARARRDKEAADAAHRTEREGVTDTQFERRMKASGENSAALQALARANLGVRSADITDRREERAAKAAEGKQLPATVLQDLADLPTAIAQLDKLGASFTEKDMGSRTAKLSGMLPESVGSALGTDTAKFNADALLAMQGVGKIMEGGKLAAGDELKYRKLLPTPGMDPTTAQRRIEEAKAHLQTLVDNRIKMLRKNGFKVSDVPGALSAAAPAAAARTMRLPSGEVVEVE